LRGGSRALLSRRENSFPGRILRGTIQRLINCENVRQSSGRSCTGWICNILVILAGFKITQRRGAPGRIRHNLESTIDQPLVKKLFEHPPHRLHKRRIQRLVVMVKVNPSSHTFNCFSPFVGVTHDNRPTFRIVFGDSHFHDVVLACDSETPVDFVFDGETVGVPAEATFYGITIDVCKAGYCVLRRQEGANSREKMTQTNLDSGSENMSVVRETLTRQVSAHAQGKKGGHSGKGRPIVEHECRPSLLDRELVGFEEGIAVAPELDDALFFFGEICEWRRHRRAGLSLSHPQEIRALRGRPGYKMMHCVSSSTRSFRKILDSDS